MIVQGKDWNTPNTHGRPFRGLGPRMLSLLLFSICQTANPCRNFHDEEQIPRATSKHSCGWDIRTPAPSFLFHASPFKSLRSRCFQDQNRETRAEFGEHPAPTSPDPRSSVSATGLLASGPLSPRRGGGDPHPGPCAQTPRRAPHAHLALAVGLGARSAHQSLL